MNAKERVVLPFVPVDMSRSAGKNGLYNHSFPFVCLKLTGFWHKLLRSRSRWKPVNSRSLQPGFCGHTRFRWLSRPVFSVQNRSRLFSRPVPFRPVPINRWWKPVQCWKVALYLDFVSIIFFHLIDSIEVISSNFLALPCNDWACQIITLHV